jgi:FixJ family two-component response regulator
MRELVSVVDDDESVREALPGLLRSFGFEVLSFASAEAFLQSASLDTTACLVLDVAMPGMTGPQLQQELAQRGIQTPIVFITALPDEGLRLQTLRDGAVAWLTKPFRQAAIVEAVNTALARRSG